MWRIYDALIDHIDPSRRADRVCLGSWRALVESGGNSGLASLLLPGGGPAQPAGDLRQLTGQPLRSLALLAKSWDSREAAIGMAAINAYYNDLTALPPAQTEFFPSGQAGGDVFQLLLPHAAGKRVATIGHFHGVGELYAPCCDFTVFEREPQPGDLPDLAAEYLLPQMELVFITGMTMTNKSLPRLIQLCSQAQVVLVGPSAPLSPLLFEFGLDLLSGLVVQDQAACRRSVTSDVVRSIYDCCGKTLVWKKGWKKGR